MKKEEIERLKEDEFVSFIEKLIRRASENKKVVFWGIGGLLAVVLLVVLGLFLKNQAAARDNQILYQAVVIKNSNLLTLDRKIEKLEALNPGRGLSSIVNNYLISMYLQQEDFDRAQKMLEQAPESRHAISNEHRQLLRAEFYRARDEHQQALDILNGQLADPRTRLAKDYLLLEIARIHRDSNRASEARDTLNRLIREYPQSLFRRDAQEMLTLLGPPKEQPAG